MASVWKAMTLLLLSLALTLCPAASQNEVTLGFVETDYSVSENDSTVSVCVGVINGSLVGVNDTVVVTVTTMDGTAVNGSDYIATPMDLTFNNMTMTEMCVDVAIVDDTILEVTESFSLSLTISSEMGDNITFTLAPNTTTVTISGNDDSVTVTVSTTPSSVMEGGSVMVCTNINTGTFGADVTLMVSTSGTADVDDYTGVMNITYESGDSANDMRCITVNITLDDILEMGEIIIFTVTSDMDGVIIMNDVTMVTITDVNRVAVSLDSYPSVMVMESVGDVMICATLSPGTLRDVVVNIATSDDTTMDSMDYTGVNTNLTFNATTLMVCVSVMIMDDSIVEMEEMFSVTLTSSDPNVDIENGTVMVIIQPDATDVVTVTVPMTLTVAEGDGMVVVYVNITGALERDVEVNVTIMSDTAVAETDYTVLDMSLTFSPGGETSIPVTVVLINDDTLLENDETFDVVVTSIDAAVMFDNSRTIITITSDDGLTLGIVGTVTSIEEGNVETECVSIMTGGVGRDVVVTITTDPTDPILTPTSLTFTEGGMNTLCFNISVPADNVLGDNYTLSISLSTVDTEVTFAPQTSNITIVDTTIVTIGFDMDMFSVAEESALDVCVSIMSASTLARNTSVMFTTTDASAMSPGDYDAVMETLVFGPGNMTIQCVTINTMADGIVAGTSNFTIDLNTDEPDRINLNENMTLVTITESDSVVIGVEQTTLTVTEGAIAVVCVNLTQGMLGRDVVVKITTMSGTATGGVEGDAEADYDDAAVNLTFNADETYRCVNISTINDNRTTEDSETFSVVLSSQEPPEIIMLDPSSATITINDAPFIAEQPADMFVFEEENATFMVQANGADLSYQWLFENENLTVSNNTPDVTNDVLMIFNVSAEDFGNYSCRVSNSIASVVSNLAQLGQLVVPVFVAPLPVDQAVINGSNVTLSCSASSVDGAVNITWSAVNNEETSLSLPAPTVYIGRGVTTSFLDLVDVDDMDAGRYTCTATNRASIPITTSFILSVITINGVEDVLVTVGLDASLFCNASGNSALSYTWERMERVNSNLTTDLTANPRITGVNTATLFFSNVSSRDAGSYICSVALFGNAIGPAVGVLNTRGPIILENPMNITVTVNDTLVLNCTAINNEDSPNPLTFAWVMNGSVRTDIDPMVTDMGNRTFLSQLVIDRVTRVDRGTYYCLVHNRGVEDFVTGEIVTVVVQFVPVVSLTANSNDELSGISTQMSFTVPDGANDTLVCVVYAIPPPSLVEIAIVASDRTVLVNVSSPTDVITRLLTVLEPQFLEDNGIIYECLATNSIGTGSDRIIQVVQDVPGPIDHDAIVRDVVDLLTVNITWPVPIDNNAPITGYMLSYCYGNIQPSSSCVSLNLVLDMVMVVMVGNDSVSAIVAFPVNSMVELNITAMNLQGEGMLLNAPYIFTTATPMDASPVNVAAVLVTTNLVILSWNVPVFAQGPGINISMFNVSISQAGSDTVITRSVGGSAGTVTYGLSVGDLDPPGLLHNVSIRAIYSNPGLISDTTDFNFNLRSLGEADVPLIDAPAVDVGGVGGTTSTTGVVGWIVPENTDFLDSYLITITSTPRTTSGRRRRRQAGSPTVNNITVTDITATDSPIPLVPFSNNSVMVQASYMPPGSTAPILVLLVEPIVIQSLEGASGPPTGVSGTPLEFNSLRVTWTPPSVPNGIIINYQLSLQVDGTNIGTRNTRTSTEETEENEAIIGSLLANTRYSIRVQAFTDSGRLGGTISEPGLGMTGAGASRTSVTVLRTATNGEYTILIAFDYSFGPLSSYQVIVTRGDPSAINPIGTFPSNPYVAFQGDVVNEDPQTTFTLGNTVSSDYNGVTYPNPRLNGNTDYFISVRVFSSVNIDVFSDSVREVTRFSPPIDPVVIIAPIAAIAVLLLVILVVLLLVAYFTMHGVPRRRTYSPGLLEDGKRRSKPGGTSVELRRTRLFSPVLNVGSPDVFTSAGQPSTLMCEASGTPAPEVAWTRNEEPLDKERFIQLADGSLFINDTDLQDEGTYVVRAVNSAGEAESAVRVTVLRPIPPEPDSEHPIIKVGEFSQKIALVRAEDDEGLEDEYADVELDWTFTSYAAKLNINKNKNRYINIIPYDHSRVVLSLQENTPGSDYINASFVDAYQRPNGYIASQGPIPSTFPDFWRMIWELDVPTIVMVTNLKEEDKVKCHQYWPSYGTTTYGNIQVTLKEVENLAEYSIRTFNVSPLAGQSRVQMPVREVRQFHFLVWPDHGVPLYATNLLSFRKRVLNYHPEKRGPMCVHCSAGVGRTGTYITIDYMLKQIDAEGVIDIFNFVRHMRYRRNYMVQTSPQYVFIHDALLESIMCGDNSIKAPELREKVKEMVEVLPETGKTPFQTQFATLLTASPPDDDFDSSIAQLPDNMAKNRGKEHLPGNDYRVVLSSADGDQSDYICASYVDNYRERNAFIVTQAPMTNTTGDFWRMIWETKSAAIVMLTELTEEEQEMCVKYWPSSGVGEPSVFGQFQVELSEDEKERGSYITRRFKLSPVDKPQESRMVSQFHFTRWTKTTPPTECRQMIDLIDELQRVQRKSGNMPITVHCSDGLSRTGAFCALYSVLERVKTEQIVDVFQAVKTLRIQRAGLLGTIEEYEYVHRAVIEFLDTFSDYQNFK